MKKLLLGALVGAILLFAWQSSSWMFLGIHDEAYKQVPNQEALIQQLSAVLTEDAQYVIPMPADTASMETHEALVKEWTGKPWATITYHKSFEHDMTMSIVRGFLIILVCVFFVCLVIRKHADKSFSSAFWTALTFGIVSFLFVTYNQHNWEGTPWSVIKGHLIDDLVGWGLVGIWLGWLYKK